MNSDCPDKVVPTLTYSVVAKEGETIDDISDHLVDAGVSAAEVNNAFIIWGYHMSEKALPDRVYRISVAGECYPSQNY